MQMAASQHLVFAANFSVVALCCGLPAEGAKGDGGRGVAVQFGASEMNLARCQRSVLGGGGLWVLGQGCFQTIE